MEALLVFVLLLLFAPLSASPVTGSGPDALVGVNSFSTTFSPADTLTGIVSFTNHLSPLDVFQSIISYLTTVSPLDALQSIISVSNAVSTTDLVKRLVPSAFDEIARSIFQLSPDCDPDHCTFASSRYGYEPSFMANAILLVLWMIVAIFHIAEVVVLRKWTFALLIVFGCLTEAAGYAARLFSSAYPFKGVPYFVQVACLTVAPALFSASIYLCLADTMHRASAEFSRFKAKFYVKVFTVADVLSVATQGAGTALALWRASSTQDPGYTLYILLGGVGLQALSMAVFMIFSVEYGVRMYRKRNLFKQRAEYDVESADIDNLIRSRTLWCFAFFLFLSSLCLLVRCVYRVFEMSQGWYGQLNKSETNFFAMESSIVIAAVTFLLLGHPGLMEMKYQVIHHQVRAQELAPIMPRRITL